MNVILGTMTFGEQLWDDDVKKIISEFLDLGYNQLDTAYVYNDGKSEELIGIAMKELSRENIKIDTKVNPRITGKLDAEAVRLQLEGSLKRIGTDYVDTYYLHFPDKATPIESALSEIDLYHRKGYLKELGLSNYPAALVKHIFNLCKENGWIVPTVYEGLYNPISRKAEQELDDCLKELNIRFNCYNPLAGGLLTNKYDDYMTLPVEGRFTFRPNYQNRYWKQAFFEATQVLKKECQRYDISIIESVFRWLSNSSMLKEERKDGIIIGVSKGVHLKENIDCINKPVLPNELIVTFDKIWKDCELEAPEYYRFYGEKE